MTTSTTDDDRACLPAEVDRAGRLRAMPSCPVLAGPRLRPRIGVADAVDLACAAVRAGICWRLENSPVGARDVSDLAVLIVVTGQQETSWASLLFVLWDKLGRPRNAGSLYWHRWAAIISTPRPGGVGAGDACGADGLTAPGPDRETR